MSREVACCAEGEDAARIGTCGGGIFGLVKSHLG